MKKKWAHQDCVYGKVTSKKFCGVTEQKRREQFFFRKKYKIKTDDKMMAKFEERVHFCPNILCIAKIRIAFRLIHVNFNWIESKEGKMADTRKATHIHARMHAYRIMVFSLHFFAIFNLRSIFFCKSYLFRN